MTKVQLSQFVAAKRYSLEAFSASLYRFCPVVQLLPHLFGVDFKRKPNQGKCAQDRVDLPGRAAPLPHARLALRVVHGSPATGREPRFTNHESRRSHHSSLATKYCCFLIASPQNIRNPSNLLTTNKKNFSNRYFFRYLVPARYLATHRIDYASDGVGAALRAAPTSRPPFCGGANAVWRQDAPLVFRWRGFFLGCGVGFSRRGPRRDDAVHARVGDGLAEM